MLQCCPFWRLWAWRGMQRPATGGPGLMMRSTLTEVVDAGLCRSDPAISWGSPDASNNGGLAPFGEFARYLHHRGAYLAPYQNLEHHSSSQAGGRRVSKCCSVTVDTKEISAYQVRSLQGAPFCRSQTSDQPTTPTTAKRVQASPPPIFKELDIPANF